MENVGPEPSKRFIVKQRTAPAAVPSANPSAQNLPSDRPAAQPPASQPAPAPQDQLAPASQGRPEFKTGGKITIKVAKKPTLPPLPGGPGTAQPQIQEPAVHVPKTPPPPEAGTVPGVPKAGKFVIKASPPQATAAPPAELPVNATTTTEPPDAQSAEISQPQGEPEPEAEEKPLKQPSGKITFKVLKKQTADAAPREDTTTPPQAQPAPAPEGKPDSAVVGKHTIRLIRPPPSTADLNANVGPANAAPGQSAPKSVSGGPLTRKAGSHITVHGHTGKTHKDQPLPQPERRADLAAIKTRRTTVRERISPAKIIGLVMVVFLVFGVIGAIRWLTSDVIVGRLWEVNGTVTLTGRSVKTAIPGTKIASGDILCTVGPKSGLLLEFEDTGELQMDSDAKAQVHSLEGGKLTRGSLNVVAEKGMLYFQIPRQPPGKPMTIGAPEATIVVSGNAHFALNVASNISEITVTDGAIAITRNMDKLSLVVRAGSQVSVGENVPFVARAISGDTRIISFTLIDAGAGVPVEGFETMKADAVLNMSKLPASIAIQANTEPAVVGSVRFQLDDDPPVIANEDPYTFRGKAKGGFGTGWKPEKGTHKLTAWAYSQKDAKGKPSIEKSVVLDVKAKK